MSAERNPVESGSSNTAGADPSKPDRFRGIEVSLWIVRAGPALILAVLVVTASLLSPIFLTSDNSGNVLAQSAVISIWSGEVLA